MKNREYKAINKVLKRELSNEYILHLLEVTRQLMPLVDGVYNTDVPFEKQTMEECNAFSFYQAKKYVCVRLPFFYKELVRMMSHGEILYSRKYAGNSECDTYTGRIYLGRNDTIQDDLSFVHEFMDHMSLKPVQTNYDINQKALLRDLFSEALSIGVELDFADKITEDNLSDDAMKAEVNYMVDAKEHALKIKVEMFLIDVYLKHGELTEDIIKNAIKECSDLELALMVSNNYEDILGEMVGWRSTLKFKNNLKHVLGILVGYQVFDNIKDDEDMVYRLAIICRRMYELGIEDFCTLFHVDLTDPAIIERYRSRIEELRPFINGNEIRPAE